MKEEESEKKKKKNLKRTVSLIIEEIETLNY